MLDEVDILSVNWYRKGWRSEGLESLKKKKKKTFLLLFVQGSNPTDQRHFDIPLTRHILKKKICFFFYFYNNNIYLPLLFSI